jgi:hypothetical protein
MPLESQGSGLQASLRRQIKRATALLSGVLIGFAGGLGGETMQALNVGVSH